MASQFRQHIKALEPANQEQGQAELKNATGIDVERDIDYVVACLLASPAARGGTEKNGYVARPRHVRPDADRGVHPREGRHRAAVQGTDDVRAPGGRRATSPDGAAHEMGVTFIDANVVALGTAAALQKVIDMQAGSAPTSGPTAN